MSDGERQRQMNFILKQQTQFAANMQQLEAADVCAAKRLDRLERVLKLAIRAGLRERKDTRAKLAALIDSHVKLADAQTHTDRRLDALIDIVKEEREEGGGAT